MSNIHTEYIIKYSHGLFACPEAEHKNVRITEVMLTVIKLRFVCI